MIPGDAKKARPVSIVRRTAPNISQGNVATRLRRGRIFNSDFIINLLSSVIVAEFWNPTILHGRIFNKSGETNNMADVWINRILLLISISG